MQLARCSSFSRVFTRYLTQSRNPLSVTCRRFVETHSHNRKQKFPYLQWGLFFVSTAAIAYFSVYFVSDGRETMQRLTANHHASIGGDFRLIDQNGMEITLADFRGKWVILYFGFIRCPDICPEQIDRLVEIQERLAIYGKDKDFVPVFITIDPERDTPAAMKKYINTFYSDRLVGLTGSTEQIHETAKKYRIYYSKGPRDADGDYVVDHTVVLYLLDPKGDFVDFYGQSKPVPEIVRRIMDFMKKYNK
nr:SCO cytochrome oxidase deficient protein 1 [Hymenolepis microstoma]